jgi:hypothetical protein
MKASKSRRFNKLGESLSPFGALANDLCEEVVSFGH